MYKSKSFCFTRDLFKQGSLRELQVGEVKKSNSNQVKSHLKVMRESTEFKFLVAQLQPHKSELMHSMEYDNERTFEQLCMRLGIPYDLSIRRNLVLLANLYIALLDGSLEPFPVQVVVKPEFRDKKPGRVTRLIAPKRKIYISRAECTRHVILRDQLIRKLAMARAYKETAADRKYVYTQMIRLMAEFDLWTGVLARTVNEEEKSELQLRIDLLALQLREYYKLEIAIIKERAHYNMRRIIYPFHNINPNH